MENNKLSTGLTVWLWIIFVVNVLAAIGGIVCPVSYTHLGWYNEADAPTTSTTTGDQATVNAKKKMCIRDRNL